MQPAPIIDEGPELVLVQAAQLGHDGDEHLFNPFLQVRAAQMVMIDDVVVIFGTKDNRNHVTPEILRCLLLACLTLFPPASPLGLDLAHTDCHLCRPQLVDGDGWHVRRAYWLHHVVPEKGWSGG